MGRESENEETPDKPVKKEHRKNKKEKKHKKRKREHPEGEEDTFKFEEKSDDNKRKHDAIQDEEQDQLIKKLQAEINDLESEKKKLKKIKVEESHETSKEVKKESRQKERDRKQEEKAKKLDQSDEDCKVSTPKQKPVEVTVKQVKQENAKPKQAQPEIDQNDRIEKLSKEQREIYDKIVHEQNQLRVKKRKGASRYVDDDLLSDQVSDFIARMEDAYLEDQKLFQQKKPAFKKLQLSQEVYQTLKKHLFQEKFLDQGGCDMLARWLDQLDPKLESYPNVNLVEGIFTCLDTMKIEADQFEKSNIFKVVDHYAQGYSKQPSIVPLAKKIIDKWNRLRFNIKSNYDSQGEFDEEYRNLHEKLDSIRRHQNSSDDGSEDEDHPKKKVTPTRTSRVINFHQRNAFDFIERPENFRVERTYKKTDPNSGRAKLEKTLLQLRKANIKSMNEKNVYGKFTTNRF